MNNNLRLLAFSLLASSIIFTFPGQSLAQNPGTDSVQTLFPASPFESGGYGGPVVKFGPMNDATGVVFGGKGGWVINRTYVIGGGGYGYSDVPFSRQTNTQVPDTNISFGYGGLELEYLYEANKVLHGTVGLFVGAGGFTVFRRHRFDQDDIEWDDDTRVLYATPCFVAEPTVCAELNILTWLRLQIGAGYRYVSGIDATKGSKHYTNSTVSGLFGMGVIKFGLY